jgi:hypothetical protein
MSDMKNDLSKEGKIALAIGLAGLTAVGIKALDSMDKKEAENTKRYVSDNETEAAKNSEENKTERTRTVVGGIKDVADGIIKGMNNIKQF